MSLYETDDLSSDIPVSIKDTGAQIPRYQTYGAAGMDIRASENKVVKSKSVEIISTDLFVAIPDGYEIQVRSRSGLAAKNSVFVLNSPGTIDSDYRGEIKIILANLGDSDFSVSTGDRIAQMVLNKVEKIKFVVADDLDDTDRSSGGLGSTGV